jgi:hypothetical protein
VVRSLVGWGDRLEQHPQRPTPRAGNAPVALRQRGR